MWGLCLGRVRCKQLANQPRPGLVRKTDQIRESDQIFQDGILLQMHSQGVTIRRHLVLTEQHGVEDDSKVLCTHLVDRGALLDATEMLDDRLECGLVDRREDDVDVLAER